MAEKIRLNRIVNANVYLDGNSLLGRVKEVKLPEIDVVMTEHKALGMVGKVELPAGFDKLSGEVVWNAFYSDVWAKIGNIFQPVQLQCRSNLEVFTAAGRTEQQALVTFLTVSFTKLPLGSFKQQEQAEFNSSFTGTYAKQVVGGVEVLEIDYLANIYRVNGVDQLSQYRANIGG